MRKVEVIIMYENFFDFYFVILIFFYKLEMIFSLI